MNVTEYTPQMPHGDDASTTILRAMRISGIGATLLSAARQDERERTTATLWFTFLFLPVVPATAERPVRSDQRNQDI